jgi:hypothetical protein
MPLAGTTITALGLLTIVIQWDEDFVQNISLKMSQIDALRRDLVRLGYTKVLSLVYENICIVQCCGEANPRPIRQKQVA